MNFRRTHRSRLIASNHPRGIVWRNRSALLPLWAMAGALLAISSILFVRPAPAVGATYFVDQRNTSAADSNDGSTTHPWKTIARATIAATQPGDIVTISEGIYRESVTLPASGTADRPIRLEAAEGAMVVVTGTDLLAGWRREAGEEAVCSIEWNHVFLNWSPSRAHPDDPKHRVIGRAEQLFVGNLPLQQVLDRKLVTRGTFFVDEPGKRLYACAANGQDLSVTGSAALRAEAATRPVLWNCTGDHVITKGLRFRYAANHAQEGAAMFAGAHDAAEDCVFERTNGIGAVFSGAAVQVLRCEFTENGQMGFAASGARAMLMTGCTTRGNNVKGFERNWEAGGNKLVLCRGAVIENSTFADNHGSGIWFDIGNEDCVVRNCLIRNNEDAGIFDEISYGLHVHDNVIIGNGLADTPGSWGAAGGVCLSSSPGSRIERNLLIGNREGISFREQSRTTPRIDAKRGTAEEAVWNHDEKIHHNVLAYNRDAQLRGWFDGDDERNWPLAMHERKGRPLSLEALRFELSDNFYASRSAPLFHWGAAWQRNIAWTSLDDVRQKLALEQRSISGTTDFADFAANDLRVPADSALIRADCYPRGAVPGIQLGTR